MRCLRSKILLKVEPSAACHRSVTALRVINEYTTKHVRSCSFTHRDEASMASVHQAASSSLPGLRGTSAKVKTQTRRSVMFDGPVGLADDMEWEGTCSKKNGGFTTSSESALCHLYHGATCTVIRSSCWRVGVIGLRIGARERFRHFLVYTRIKTHFSQSYSRYL